MFGFQSLGTSFSLSNPNLSGATLPVNAVIFLANNDFSNYENKSKWNFIDMSQSDGTPSIIKSVVSNLVNTKQSIQKDVSSTTTTGIAGGHSLPDGATSAYQFSQPVNNNRVPYNQDYYSYANGDHSHSVTTPSSAINLAYPKSIVVGSYKLNQSTTEIPKNTIIFTNNPTDDYTLVTNANNCFLISGSASWLSSNFTSNSGIYGSNSYSTSSAILTTVSTSGAHYHGNGAKGNGYSAVSTASYSFYSYQSAGNHSHGVSQTSLSASIQLKRTILRVYKANKNTGITYGMIIGYSDSNTENLPFGWYLCNGQTVGSYKTPDLSNRYIQLSASQHNVNNATSFDFNRYDYTYTLSTASNYHDHSYSGAASIRYDNRYNANHIGGPVSHNHSGTGNMNYEPSYYGISFIIYLGS